MPHVLLAGDDELENLYILRRLFLDEVVAAAAGGKAEAPRHRAHSLEELSLRTRMKSRKTLLNRQQDEEEAKQEAAKVYESPEDYGLDAGQLGHVLQRFFERVQGRRVPKQRIAQIISSVDSRLDNELFYWRDMVDFVLWEGRNKDAELAVTAVPTIVPVAINNVRQEQQHHHHSQSICRIVRTECTRNDPLYITASADGSVRAWFVDTLQHRNTWLISSIHNRRRTALVTDLAYSQALEQISVSTAERVVNVYSVYYTDQVESLVGLPAAALSLAYCPKQRTEGGEVGEALIMGDKQGFITAHFPIGKTMWKVDTNVIRGPWLGAGAQRLKVHDGWILRMKYVSSLRLLVTTSTDKTVKLVDVDTMEVKGTFNGHQHSVRGVVYCPSTRHMASCGAERHISLWNPYTCSETGRLEGHNAPVIDLVVNDKEKQIVSVSLDSVIKASALFCVWDLQRQCCVQTLQDKSRSGLRPDAKMLTLFHDVDEGRIITARASLYVWPFGTAGSLSNKALMSHECEVRDAKFVRKHGTVISAGADGLVQVWSAATGQRRFHLRTGHEGMLTSLEVDEGGDRLLSAADDGSVIAWTLHNGQHLRTLHAREGLLSALKRRATPSNAAGQTHRALMSGLTQSLSARYGSSTARKFVTDLCFATLSASQSYVVVCGWGLPVIALPFKDHVSAERLGGVRTFPADWSLALGGSSSCSRATVARPDGAPLVSRAQPEAIEAPPSIAALRKLRTRTLGEYYVAVSAPEARPHSSMRRKAAVANTSAAPEVDAADASANTGNGVSARMEAAPPSVSAKRSQRKRPQRKHLFGRPNAQASATVQRAKTPGVARATPGHQRRGNDAAHTAPIVRRTRARPPPHTPQALLDEAGNPVSAVLSPRVPRALALRHERLRVLTDMDNKGTAERDEDGGGLHASTAPSVDPPSPPPPLGGAAPRPRRPRTAASRVRPSTARTAVVRGRRLVSAQSRTEGAQVSKSRHAHSSEAAEPRMSRGHTGDVQCVCFCPPSMVASGGSDGLVFVWSLDTGAALNEFRWNDSDPARLLAQADRRPGDEDLHHDGAAAQYDAPFDSTDMGSCDSIAFCRHLVSVAAGYSNGWIVFWHIFSAACVLSIDTSTARPSQVLRNPPSSPSKVKRKHNSFGVSTLTVWEPRQGAKLLAVGTSHGHTQLWDFTHVKAVETSGRSAVASEFGCISSWECTATGADVRSVACIQADDLHLELQPDAAAETAAASAPKPAPLNQAADVDGGVLAKVHAKRRPPRVRYATSLKEYHVAQLRRHGLLRGDKRYPELLLTSHSAGAVELWTIWGDCIGMFGQMTPWSTSQPSSWRHGAPVMPKSAPRSAASFLGPQRRQSRSGRRRHRIQTRVDVLAAAPSFRREQAAGTETRVEHIGVDTAPEPVTAANSGSPFGRASPVSGLLDDLDAMSVSSGMLGDDTMTSSPRVASPAIQSGLEAPPRRTSTSARLNDLLLRASSRHDSAPPAWLHLSKQKFFPSWHVGERPIAMSSRGKRRRRSSLPEVVPAHLGVGTLSVALSRVTRAAARARRAVEQRRRAAELVQGVTRRALSPAMWSATSADARGSSATRSRANSRHSSITSAGSPFSDPEDDSVGDTKTLLHPAVSAMRQRLRRYASHRSLESTGSDQPGTSTPRRPSSLSIATSRSPSRSTLFGPPATPITTAPRRASGASASSIAAGGDESPQARPKSRVSGAAGLWRVDTPPADQPRARRHSFDSLQGVDKDELVHLLELQQLKRPPRPTGARRGGNTSTTVTFNPRAFQRRAVDLAPTAGSSRGRSRHRAADATQRSTATARTSKSTSTSATEAVLARLRRQWQDKGSSLPRHLHDRSAVKVVVRVPADPHVMMHQHTKPR